MVTPFELASSGHVDQIPIWNKLKGGFSLWSNIGTVNRLFYLVVFSMLVMSVNKHELMFNLNNIH